VEPDLAHGIERTVTATIAVAVNQAGLCGDVRVLDDDQLDPHIPTFLGHLSIR
jgi:hypothetical protein